MQCVELNPVGNFDPWEQEKIDELFNEELTEALGNKLVFENSHVKLWEIKLLPGERIPFRRHNTNFNWVSTTGGLALGRYGNGKISMMKINPGDTAYWELAGKDYKYDMENIGDTTIVINILEFKHVRVGNQAFFAN